MSEKSDPTSTPGPKPPNTLQYSDGGLRQPPLGTIGRFILGVTFSIGLLCAVCACKSLGFITSASNLFAAALILLLVLFGLGAFLRVTQGWRGFLPGLAVGMCLSCMIGGIWMVFVVGYAIANCKPV